MNVRYFMRKRERYKHLLNLFANFVMLVAETAMFAFIWYKMYVPELEDKFWNRGNWAVIGMYALVLFFFIRTFGGYRIGYLRITDIFDDGTLNLSELKSVDAPNSDKYILKPNDIVFARTGGSTGRNYFYDGSDGVFVYAGFLIKFSIDPEKVNPKYVKYYCRSKQYNDWVQSFNTGSTRGNINAQIFGNMEIPLPERKQQDYLVSILEPIDEKIRNNKQVNDNLAA